MAKSNDTRAKNRVERKDNPKQVAYKILYRDARAYSTLRRAKFFKLYYGRRPVSGWIAFPKRAKTVTQKRTILLKLLESVEYQHQIALEKRRIKAQAKKALAKQVKEEKKRAKQIKEVTGFIKKEKLNTKRIRFSDPTYKGFQDSGAIGKVKITPVITGTGLYKKEILKKKVRSPGRRANLDLKILDFTLTKPILMSRDNARAVKEEVMALFKPHLTKFYKESKNSLRLFIYRTKYNLLLPGNKKAKQGMGGARFIVEDFKSYDAFEFFIQENFELLESEIMNRYLAMTAGGEIEITGFSIENIISETKNE